MRLKVSKCQVLKVRLTSQQWKIERWVITITIAISRAGEWWAVSLQIKRWQGDSAPWEYKYLPYSWCRVLTCSWQPAETINTHDKTLEWASQINKFCPCYQPAMAHSPLHNPIEGCPPNKLGRAQSYGCAYWSLLSCCHCEQVSSRFVADIFGLSA